MYANDTTTDVYPSTNNTTFSRITDSYIEDVSPKTIFHANNEKSV